MLYDVNRLVANGYVERTPDPTDKRAQLLSLTPLEWRVVHISREVMNEINAEFTELVGQKQFDDLQQTLLQIVNGIEQRN
jgi:DNA-binding MarR family transcriptional regulator